MTRSFVRAIVVIGALLPTPALAQTRPAPGSTREFTVGGLWLGPASFGSASADLLRPDGTPLTVFEAENSLGPGIGLQAGMAFRLTPSVWTEITAGWSRASLRTTITGDVENADVEPIRARVMRVSLEASALWYVHPRGSTSWFVRGGGGWAKELAEGNALAEDAFSATGGAGVRHWWREGRRSKVQRMGLRIEFRADLRSGGITLGGSGLRLSPGAAGHVVLGF